MPAVETVVIEWPWRKIVTRSATDEDLGQLVGDEDHRLAGASHVAHAREELVGFLRRQYGGRLVEDEDPGAPVEGFQDLDPLALPERELPDPRLRVDGHLETVGCLGDRLFDFPRRKAQPRLGPSEHHVLGDGHALHKAQMLVDHKDASVLRVPRGVEPDGLAVDEELAFIGPVEAHQEIAQRGLAGPVLAEQGVHLPRCRLERHVVVGDDAGKALRHLDGLHCQCSRRTAGNTGSRA